MSDEADAANQRMKRFSMFTLGDRCVAVRRLGSTFEMSTGLSFESGAGGSDEDTDRASIREIGRGAVGVGHALILRACISRSRGTPLQQ